MGVKLQAKIETDSLSPFCSPIFAAVINELLKSFLLK